MKLWCEFAWLGGDQADSDVTIGIEAGKIATVEAGTRPPADAERLPGLTVPGFANVHSHAFQRILRGRTHSGHGDFWTWRRQMYAALDGLDPDRYLALATATFAEMAEAGITVVGEFHYLHHAPGGGRYDDPNAMGRAILEAARRAGIRITLLDTCYLHGGIDTTPDEAQIRFSDGDADAWAERVELIDGEVAASHGQENGGIPMARVGAAIHSVRAVDPGSAARVAEWASAHEAPLHAHVSEQPAENEACQAAYGATPSALLEAAGATGPRFTAVHATHLDEGDFARLGGGGVCLCPTTERDLADGIGPARRLLDAGASISIGTDSNAVIDP
ncbi:MAG TPA: formimidoylglutamate deiminase, partial [Solirubrobacterales bacterium]|nr:formimidoylglutamate deiminase [Solirubrobacterales bacterium]